MQFKKRTYLILVLVILTFILLNFKQNTSHLPEDANFFDRAVVALYTPFQMVFNWGASSVKNMWRSYLFLVDTKQENIKLKEELEIKNLYILSLKERLKINENQEKTTATLKDLNLKGVNARVVGFDPFSQSQTVWVNAGINKEIKIDQAVITYKGLVGRVINVFSETSQVLLMTDIHFAVDVINEESRVRALLVGTGKDAALKRYPILSHLEFLELGDPMNSGDLLVTSGLGGIFPYGIPVGNILRNDKKNQGSLGYPQVIPVVDVTQLEELIIITTPVSSNIPTEVSEPQ